MQKLTPAPIVGSVLAAALVAGCSGSQPANQAAATPMAESGSPGVTREEVPSPTPTPAAAPAPAAIQVQPGPKGAQVALNRVSVTGDIMTVALTYSGSTCCIYTTIDQVSAIDDATAQRLGVLKDNAGHWMAAPLYGDDNKQIWINSSDKTPAQVWFKFPAPPATSKTVSISIPEVAPFDGVPVTR